MDKPEISIIIISYNVWSYLKPCLASVLRQENIAVEIIVVDNHSSDGTPDLIRKEFPSVHVMTNTENKGFSAANNQGINASKGDSILLLNPDTELKKEDILLKMNALLKDNKGDVVAPCLLNSDGSFQPSFWTTSTFKQLGFELFYLHPLIKTHKPAQTMPVMAASGAALFFKKALTDKIGLLDEKMFWMEDVDFCYRARQAGAKILYDPRVEIVHHGGKSSTNYSVVMPNQVISKIKFYKKHASFMPYASVNILSLLFIVSRLCMFALCSVSGNDTFVRKRKAYTLAMKAWFKYNFRGDGAIINKQG